MVELGSGQSAMRLMHYCFCSMLQIQNSACASCAALPLQMQHPAPWHDPQGANMNRMLRPCLLVGSGGG